MTSTIKVNTITTESGSTLTVGGCGKTVALASGASQTGFGRTGTVDWQTGSIKTATFTAANGEGYFCNTSGGAFTVNLPAGSAGAIISVSDYTNTFQTNNLTISPNGSQKINGIADNAILSTEGQSVTLIYVDDTEGWKNVQDSTSNVTGNAFIVATGGTITESGDCKIHTFTGPGTFTVSTAAVCAAHNKVSHLVVAGGGGAGGFHGGGGGAGGFREAKSPVTPYCSSPLDGGSPNTITVTATAFPITVGAGGVGKKGPSAPGGPNTPTSGSNSIFSTVTSAGGGNGGGNASSANQVGTAGGSGGGGQNGTSGNPGGPAGGAGNTPPVSPAQGFAGGEGGSDDATFRGGGGGGGATAVGANVNPSGPDTATDSVGPGGAGATTSINASATAFAGGGGGGSTCVSGTGGTGGGGSGGTNPSPNQATAGTANTGGGGGGSGNPCSSTAGSGGSGIVIIRYKFK
jgi:hypothetical protein